jgi:trimeric autotransporter adhesin
MKTTFVTTSILTVLLNFTVKAQNVSDQRNNIPITGSNCTGYGWRVLANNFSSSVNNTAVGHESLHKNQNGYSNTSLGAGSLYNCVDGFENTAVGDSALFSLTDGLWNVAIGKSALFSTTTGSYNIASGYKALYNNSIGEGNIAIGWAPLYNNTTGMNNIAIGHLASNSNVTGVYNIAIGTEALNFNDGNENLAVGNGALYSNTSGQFNTGIGDNSLSTNTTGNFNSGFGILADVSASNYTNATAIGANAVVNASQKVRIGSTLVTVVEGQVPYSNPSDGRFKNNIKSEDIIGLDFIKKLRPVAYNFDTKKYQEFLCKNMTDSIRKKHLNFSFQEFSSIRQSGFIAQEVEKAALDVGYDFNGLHKPVDENDNYSLAYSQFVVPLVKAVQEQQEMIETLSNKIKELTEQKYNNSLKVDLETNGININEIENYFNILEQNEPNPFTHETLIKYHLPKGLTKPTIGIFDLSGKQIVSLPITQTSDSSIRINSEKLAAGIYLYAIISEGKVIDLKRMVVDDK